MAGIDLPVVLASSPGFKMAALAPLAPRAPLRCRWEGPRAAQHAGLPLRYGAKGGNANYTAARKESPRKLGKNDSRSPSPRQLMVAAVDDVISGYEQQLVAFRDSNRALSNQHEHLQQLSAQKLMELKRTTQVDTQASHVMDTNDTDDLFKSFMVGLDYTTPSGPAGVELADRSDINENAAFERMLVLAKNELASVAEEKHEVLTRLGLQHELAVQQLTDAKLQLLQQKAQRIELEKLMAEDADMARLRLKGVETFLAQASKDVTETRSRRDADQSELEIVRSDVSELEISNTKLSHRLVSLTEAQTSLTELSPTFQNADREEAQKLEEELGHLQKERADMIEQGNLRHAGLRGQIQSLDAQWTEEQKKLCCLTANCEEIRVVMASLTTAEHTARLETKESRRLAGQNMERTKARISSCQDRTEHDLAAWSKRITQAKLNLMTLVRETRQQVADSDLIEESMEANANTIQEEGSIRLSALEHDKTSRSKHCIIEDAKQCENALQTRKQLAARTRQNTSDAHLKLMRSITQGAKDKLANLASERANVLQAHSAAMASQKAESEVRCKGACSDIRRSSEQAIQKAKVELFEELQRLQPEYGHGVHRAQLETAESLIRRRQSRKQALTMVREEVRTHTSAVQVRTRHALSLA